MLFITIVIFNIGSVVAQTSENNVNSTEQKNTLIQQGVSQTGESETPSTREPAPENLTTNDDPEQQKSEPDTQSDTQTTEQGVSQEVQPAVDPLKSASEFYKSFDPEKIQASPTCRGRECKPDGLSTPEPMPIFGYQFFTPARNRIIEMEKRLISGKESESARKESGLAGKTTDISSEDTAAIQQARAIRERSAVSGFIGPLEMTTTNFYATIPQNYILKPGDILKASFWGKTVDPMELKLLIDPEGMIAIPKIGKVTASGLTLERFQKNLDTLIEKSPHRYMKHVITLDQLQSIQISISGEAFRPGTYAVSAATTLFNALYACGGPSKNGALRDIRLLRNRKIIRIDFYDFLLHGTNSDDIPLQPGDTVFIPLAKKTALINGEVVRPNRYELKADENLEALIDLAGGIKASGIYENIQIKTLDHNKQKTLININLRTDQEKIGQLVLNYGDEVTVFSVLPSLANAVILEGAVERPGTYQLKEGMRISDLFSPTNLVLGEAATERADIIRLNDDGRTTTIIPIHLGKALAEAENHNIYLKENDRIIIYSKWDLRYIPPKVVTIVGSVQNPARYERSESMRISDLLVTAGGLMPQTHLERADLLRYDFVKKISRLIPVNLQTVLGGDPSENRLLQDRDRLIVYTSEEISYTPVHEVFIFGAVQRPGSYPRSINIKLKDLIFAAGGTIPGYYENIEIVRSSKVKGIEIIAINIDQLLQGDDSLNVELKDQDIVMVKKRSEYFDKPLLVTVNGEVKYPGTYALRSRTDRISEVINRSGGLTDLAYPKGTVFKRKREYTTSEEVTNDITSVNDLFKLINQQDFQRQYARNQYLLSKEIGTESQAPLDRSAAAAIAGNSDVSKETAGKAMLGPDISRAAGDTVGSAFDAFSSKPSVTSPARDLGQAQLIPSERVIIDITAAIATPGSNNDLFLVEGDTITFPRKPTVVNVIGAVTRPTKVSYSSNNIEDYIAVAGGFHIDANVEKVMIFRLDGSLIPEEKINLVEPGDTIYVPTKPVSVEIVTTTDKILDTIKFALVAITSYWALISILAL